MARRFHEVVHGVYFDDLDAFGILHNARYLLLFERTLGAFWEALGVGTPALGLRPDAPADHWHLVRANHIEYLLPVRGTGRVRVRVWVEKLGTTSLTVGFRVCPIDRDEDYASGSRVLVCVDPSTQRPTPWSADLRARLAEWVSP